MTLSTPTLSLDLDHLCCSGYEDTLRALAEDYLNRHSWSDGLSSDPWERILEGENLLTAALLLTLSEKKVDEEPKLLEGIQAFATHCNWPEIPLITAQVQLLKVFAEGRQPNPPAEVKGIIPFATGRYWDWSDVVFTHRNCQLGILYALIAFLGGPSEFADAAKAIADWQTQLLDVDFTPTTLFQREGSVSELELIACHHLLYRSVAQLHGCSRSASIAEKLKEKLSPHPKLSTFYSVVNFYLDRQNPLPTSTFEPLPQIIADPEVMLAGMRTASRTFLCSLTGSRTGLGYVRRGDVKIVAYGPQALPLSECSEFGIEATMMAKHRSIQVDELGFSMSQIVKLPCEPPVNGHPATFGMLPAPYNFAEIRQEFSNEILTINFTPHTWEGHPELAFVFFVKATNCMLEDGKLIKPHSHDRYRGPCQSLALQGAESILTLIPQDGNEYLQIIPLGGRDLFWGADYLISFTVPKCGRQYRWKLT